jgi:hypothetical protein
MSRVTPRPGRWRIGVRGRLSSRTTSLPPGLHVVTSDTTTLLETEPLAPDTCTSTLSTLQSLGLEVVDVHWVPVEGRGQ